MESIIEKVFEADSLGINYIFMGIDSQLNDNKNPITWLKCSQYGYAFVENFSLLQAFSEFCSKNNKYELNILSSDCNLVEANYCKIEKEDGSHIQNAIPTICKSSNEIMIFPTEVPKVITSSIKQNELTSRRRNIRKIENKSKMTNHVSDLNILGLDIKTNKHNMKKRNINKSVDNLTTEKEIPNLDNTNSNLNLHSNKFGIKIGKIPTVKAYNFSCETCSKGFDTETSLKLHSWIHEKNNIDCLVPNISYMDDKAMYRCNDCEKLFTNKNLAEMHAWRHRDGQIDNKIRLGVHIPEHERSFLCDDCGKRFATLASARGHYKRVHQIDVV